MTIHQLILLFMFTKTQKPSHANELLDFLQKIYLDGMVSISEYKSLFGELERRGAKIPGYPIQDHDDKKAL